ncbi:serine hydrolase [Lutibacter sp.]|uniref:serine hydrolase domain-containing protein n=1 Tax=Lutibacter sp. TaxID=1925666 RepID=UPI002735A38D|nr:serine hydrolase [Lutibacter sp.]MDP3313932.1 serine hydrolase [Lutibacter sp.]
MNRFLTPFFLYILLSCNSSEDVSSTDNNLNNQYFPPINSQEWENSTPESLNWNTSSLNSLYDFLSSKNTRAFIVLKNGKIVLEKYWGSTITNTGNFDKNSSWYWASAGKTITAYLVGIAQEDGLLNINSKTSTYLGAYWSSLPLEKENLITVKHQLTMTTGLDYNVLDVDCTDAICLKYKVDAGSQWFYHNAPYTLLEKVVSNTAGITYNQYTENNLNSKIGMKGTWIKSGYNNVFYSTARDAARFGLLILNNGKWETKQLMKDATYFKNMITSSQSLNPSYGYLWWLNGKSSIVYPVLPNSFNTSLAPAAPTDLVAAMGKNGQFIDILPSKNIVVIRFGEAPDNSLVPIIFHNEIWQYLSAIIN